MKNLAEIRRSFGLSQKELAEALGVAQNTVSNWENGRRHINTKTLNSLSSFFAVSVDELMGHDPIERGHSLKGHEQQSIKELIAHEYGGEAVNILSSLNKLNEKGRARAVQALDEISQIPGYKAAEKIYTLRAARSSNKKSSITKNVCPKTIEKLRQASAIKDEKDLK